MGDLRAEHVFPRPQSRFGSVLDFSISMAVGKWLHGMPGQRHLRSDQREQVTGIFLIKFLLYFLLSFSPHIPEVTTLLSMSFPSSHHTVIHVQESLFFFAQFLHPLTSPQPLAVILSSTYESVPIFRLIVQFVH